MDGVLHFLEERHSFAEPVLNEKGENVFTCEICGYSYIPMPGKKIKKVTTRQEKKMRNKLTPMVNGLSIKKPVILRMV